MPKPPKTEKTETLVETITEGVKTETMTEEIPTTPPDLSIEEAAALSNATADVKAGRVSEVSPAVLLSSPAPFPLDSVESAFAIRESEAPASIRVEGPGGTRVVDMTGAVATKLTRGVYSDLPSLTPEEVAGIQHAVDGAAHAAHWNPTHRVATSECVFGVMLDPETGNAFTCSEWTGPMDKPIEHRQVNGVWTFKGEPLPDGMRVMAIVEAVPEFLKG